MSRNYPEIMSDRRAKLAPSAVADRAVFEQAYDIALQIVELRERSGFTQAELAERCGVDQGDISRIERGATSPTTKTLQRIARALDADLRLVARAG
jgi:predicted transcriptional regulator